MPAAPALRVLATDPDSAPARLHRLIATREALRAAFQPVWREITDDAADAAINAWCEASLALLHVHAGPAALLAFWSLRPVEGASLADVAAVGQAAAAICREAGAA
ncbi:hypothetical protein, partial [Acidisphaera rubrifaciens]|uniref:hypothetical protein n=1 Tax=Acidisphaera rubrifaciens TaxID=50715 RepID=UPI000662B6BA